MLRGGRTREGQELWTDTTPLPEQIEIGMKHVIKTLKPTTAPFERAYKGARGIPGKGPPMYEVQKNSGIFGFRLERCRSRKSIRVLFI